MKRDSLHIGQQLTIQTAQMLMVCYVLIHHRHLAATDTRTNVTHAIVIAYLLMLIIRISLTCLCGIEHNLLLCLRIRTNQGTATAGGYHLVAIERQHTIFAKRTTNPSFVPTAETFRSILNHRNAILLRHSHYFIQLGWHTI